MEWWLAYLAIGVVAGFLAGLLGIGGGSVIVPMLVWAFTAQGIPAAHVLHLALGTSMATIFFTSLASMRAHHRHGAVDWAVARAMAPGILAGSFGAALAAAYIPTRPLAVIFTVLAFWAATQFLLNLKPRTARALPGRVGVFSAGAGVGIASSLLAAGGAFLSIPFLVWCGIDVRRAIGTAAANGLPIAIAGSAGYVAQGLRTADLPAGAVGFVYMPALALIVLASMSVAPLGARTAYRLPLRQLRVLLALMLYALALRTLATLW